MPDEFDDVVEGAISQFTASEDAAPPSDAPPEEPPKQEGSAPGAEVKPPAEDEQRYSAIAVKLQRRERELAKREAALKAAETSKPEPPPQPKIDPRTDPVGFFKSLGLDAAETARYILATEARDKVPKEYLDRAEQFMQRNTVTAQLEALQAKIAEQDKRLAEYQAQQLSMTQAKTAFAEMEATVAKVAPTEKQPYAGHLHTTKPEFFRKEVLREILEDAQRRLPVEGPGATAISPEEAIARIDARLANYGFEINAPKAPQKNVGAALQTRNSKHVQEEETFEDVQAKAMRDFLQVG